VNKNWSISLSCPSVKMCLLEKAIAAKHLGTIKFLLYEDPSVFDHILNCGVTVKEKTIELGFNEAIMTHLAKRDATEIVA
jgi:hypothetical protein